MVFAYYMKSSYNLKIKKGAARLQTKLPQNDHEVLKFMTLK
jgi:hypothetical protein